MSLYGALLIGRYSKARRLIGRRAGINTPGDGGETPLMCCTFLAGREDMLRLLLQAGADVNARNFYGETAFMTALWSPSKQENLSLLLANGADINLVTDYGYMARDLALYDSGLDLNRFFPENIERKAIRKMADTADAASLEKICQEQPIDEVLLRIMLRDAMDSEDVDKVEVLLKFGVPVDSQSRYGSTALMNAACRTRMDLVKLLLRYGANPAHQDRNEMTAIMKMKDCFPGLKVTELLYDEGYALEVIGKERMKEIAAVQSEIERLLE